MTSQFWPSMDSFISVTSSGRSSIRRTMMCMPGWDALTDAATCFKRVVLPALGWATIIPLWPLPIGEKRSTIRMATEAPGYSNLILSLGKTGVISSKVGRSAIISGFIPLMCSMNRSAPYLSLGLFLRVLPVTRSPVFILKRRI